jgi:hypothetical protein
VTPASPGTGPEKRVGKMSTSSRARILRIGAISIACVGLAAGVVVGSVGDDVDAAKQKQLKTLWAVVQLGADHEITVTHAKGVKESSKLGIGTYKIGFNRNISGCAYAASQISSGFLAVTGGPRYGVMTEREILVEAFDADAFTRVERSFHLIAHCCRPVWALPRSSRSRGVVGSGAMRRSPQARTGPY